MMRRTVGLLFSFAMIFSLAACSSSEDSERPGEQPAAVFVQSEEVQASAGDKITDMTERSDGQRNLVQDAKQETEGQVKEQQETDMAAKTLVVYFSATGTTKPLAEYAAEILGADIYELIAEEPYTEADLAYYTGGRADQEQNDPDARPAISGSVENMDSYDTILIGSPYGMGRPPELSVHFWRAMIFPERRSFRSVPLIAAGLDPARPIFTRVALTQWSGPVAGGLKQELPGIPWRNGLAV